jgi:putative oxidoreductase
LGIAAMTRFGSDKIQDEVILIARILLMAIFLISGWGKLTNYEGAVAYMAETGVPLPPIAAIIAIVMEFFVGMIIVVGLYTRPLAIVLALYALATAFIGHHYWSMTGAVQADNMIHFYKNISILGGLLLLYVTGAGKYSIDAWFGMAVEMPDRSNSFRA